MIGRRRYPEPDRSYLGVMESIKYHIDSIEHALMLRTDDPDPTSFSACLRHSAALHELLKIGAISQERKLYEFRDI